MSVSEFVSRFYDEFMFVSVSEFVSRFYNEVMSVSEFTSHLLCEYMSMSEFASPFLCELMSIRFYPLFWTMMELPSYFIGMKVNHINIISKKKDKNLF